MTKKIEQIKIDKNLFDGIMFAYSMFHKQVFRSLKGSGLTAGQPKILEFLAQSEPVIQKEIAKACEIETSTVGRLLRKLESSDLIQRKILPENRRVVQISLTDFGRKKASIVQEAFHACEETAFFGIEKGQRCYFVQTLRQMEENLRAGAIESGRKQGCISQQKDIGSATVVKPFEVSLPLEQEMPKRSLHQELQACQSLLYQQLFRFLKDTDLTPGQPKILEFLENGEGSQQKDIAAACRIEPATVTSLLFYMEQAGLIERREENGDRRSQHVYLTQKGRQNMQKTIQALEKTMEMAFSGMEREQVAFRETLRLLHGNLRQAVEEEGYR